MTRLGQHQLQLLIVLGSPTAALVVSDKISASLVRRGLLREREPGGLCCITPDGLRALAAEMESGRVDDALEAMRKDVEARQARMAAKRKVPR